MKRITSEELRNLPFGSKVRIIWHNSKSHEKGEEYFGVIFGNHIGYENGKADLVKIVAECAFNDWCMLYLLTE